MSKQQQPKPPADPTVTKPYTQTSYFKLMLAVVVLGLPFLWAVSALLPVFPLDDEQRTRAFTMLFNGWVSSIEITVGGNVAARGAVTIIRSLAESGLLGRFKSLSTFLAPDGQTGQATASLVPPLSDAPQTSMFDGATLSPGTLGSALTGKLSDEAVQQVTDIFHNVIEQHKTKDKEVTADA